MSDINYVSPCLVLRGGFKPKTELGRPKKISFLKLKKHTHKHGRMPNHPLRSQILLFDPKHPKQKLLLPLIFKNQKLKPNLSMKKLLSLCWN